ncbi:MAG: TldD/PmbA family protein [Oscillospiraceae bacterium]|nr:TldD/PmbA family protein [Oscillospiraceae bacterium]
MGHELYETAEYALRELRAKGADGAEVRVSRGAMDELNLDAGKFSLMRTTFSSSISVRALIGSRKGTHSTNRLDRGTVDAAVAAAVEAAASSDPDEAEVISAGIGGHEFDLGKAPSEPGLIYDRMDGFMKAVKEGYPLTDVMQFIVCHNGWDAAYANTNGTRAMTAASQYNVSVTFSTRDGDRTTSMNGSGYTAKDLGMEILSYPELRRLIAGSAAELDARPVEGKFTGSLLCSPECFGEFLGEVLGNCVGGGSIISGTSPWKDSLGAEVADRRLSVSFDPLHARVVNGSRMQDGYLAARQEIISGGVLKAFALNEYAALKTGLTRASATDCMVIEPGDLTLDGLIAGIDRGILINRFSGGSMAPNGDFSGVAKNSFLIEGGKVVGAVAETMVSGNMLEMLKNLKGLGSEQDFGGGSAIPWASFDGIVISGK